MFGLGNPQAARRDKAPAGTEITVEALMGLEFAPALPPDFPKLALARRPGVSPTKAAGQGHMIRDLRPFADGDDPRHIDAAASARLGSLHLRSFHEDREGNLVLVADFRRPMLWGTKGRLRSLAAAEVLMRLGWAAMREGGAVGVITLSDHGMEVTRPRPRRTGLLRVANHLARAHNFSIRHINEGRTPALEAELALAARHLPSGAMTALASGLDQGGPALSGALDIMARRGPFSLFLIEDQFERSPPPQALPVRREGERRPLALEFDRLSHQRQERAESLRVAGMKIYRIAADETIAGGLS